MPDIMMLCMTSPEEKRDSHHLIILQKISNTVTTFTRWFSVRPIIPSSRHRTRETLKQGTAAILSLLYNRPNTTMIVSVIYYLRILLYLCYFLYNTRTVKGLEIKNYKNYVVSSFCSYHQNRHYSNGIRSSSSPRKQLEKKQHHREILQLLFREKDHGEDNHVTNDKNSAQTKQWKNKHFELKTHPLRTLLNHNDDNDDKEENCQHSNDLFHHNRRSLLKKATCTSSIHLILTALVGGWSSSLVAQPVFASTTTQDIQVSSMERKPWAPTEALLPATRVRLLLQQVLQLAIALNECCNNENGNTQQHQDIYLEQLDAILKSPKTGQDLIPNTSIRISFDIYTSYLRYDDQYSFVGSKEEKSKYIRNFGMLPNVKQVIQADLDLRDLYRNEVLTNVDEARAELRYLIDETTAQRIGGGERKPPKGTMETNHPQFVPSQEKEQQRQESKIDTSELVRLLENASTACDKWFAMIGPEDVEEARSLVLAEIAMTTTLNK